MNDHSFPIACLLVFATLQLGMMGAAQAAPSSQATDPCASLANAQARQACAAAVQQGNSGDLEASLILMRNALAASPKEGRIRVMIGQILLRKGGTVAAERELRQARKDGAPDALVLPLLLRAMLEQHKEIGLLDEFPDPPRDAKGDVVQDILYARALALRSLDRPDEAAAALDRRLALKPEPVSLQLRAEIAIQQNNRALADKLVDEALQLDPNFAPALIAKLETLEGSGDTGKIMAFTDRILKTYPRNIDALAARIRVHLKLNQDDKAKTDVDGILARSHRDPIGLFYRAVLEARAKNNGGAFQLISSLPADFAKAHPQLAIQMAQIAFDNGEIDAGAAYLGTALGAAPDLLDTRLLLADVRMRQELPQTAMTVLAPIKDLPDPRVKKLLARVNAAIAKNRSF